MNKNHNDSTHDTVEVKIENLKKVYDEHAKKKRQRLDGDESSVYDTVDLIDDEDRPQQEATLEVIDETGQTEVAAAPTIITAEEEFIPVGSRVRCHGHLISLRLPQMMKLQDRVLAVLQTQ